MCFKKPFVLLEVLYVAIVTCIYLLTETIRGKTSSVGHNE